MLHVDDDPSLTEMVADFLERENDGLEIVTAERADEGLAVLADGDIDCVISDYDMPGMDGIEFLRAVREAHGDFPCILYTGKGSEEVAIGWTSSLPSEGVFSFCHEPAFSVASSMWVNTRRPALL